MSLLLETAKHLRAYPALLFDDGTIEIEFAYHNGDEAVL